MALVRMKWVGILSMVLATSALGAESKEVPVAPQKPSKKAKTEVAKATPVLLPAVARSGTAEGVPVFEVAKPKSRPLIVLKTKQSEAFKSIALVMGIKTPEIVPPRQTPEPSSQRPSSGENPGTSDPEGKKSEPTAPALTAQPQREKTVDEIEAEKAENAAAEAAELPVDLGPIE